jgi:hypothetical protein
MYVFVWADRQYMYIYIYIHTCVCIYDNGCMCMYGHASRHVHVTLLCILCLHPSIHPSIHPYINTYVHTYTNTHIHIHAHIMHSYANIQHKAHTPHPATALITKTTRISYTHLSLTGVHMKCDLSKALLIASTSSTGANRPTCSYRKGTQLSKMSVMKFCKRSS